MDKIELPDPAAEKVQKMNQQLQQLQRQYQEYINGLADGLEVPTEYTMQAQKGAFVRSTSEGEGGDS